MFQIIDPIHGRRPLRNTSVVGVLFIIILSYRVSAKANLIAARLLPLGGVILILASCMTWTLPYALAVFEHRRGSRRWNWVEWVGLGLVMGFLILRVCHELCRVAVINLEALFTRELVFLWASFVVALFLSLVLAERWFGPALVATPGRLSDRWSEQSNPSSPDSSQKPSASRITRSQITILSLMVAVVPAVLMLGSRVALRRFLKPHLTVRVFNKTTTPLGDVQYRFTRARAAGGFGRTKDGGGGGASGFLEPGAMDCWDVELSGNADFIFSCRTPDGTVRKGHGSVSIEGIYPRSLDFLVEAAGVRAIVNRGK
jgi:hypothetical protein